MASAEDDAVLPRLKRILSDAAEDVVLVAAIRALGMAWDPRAADIILDLAPLDHQNVEVRRSVVQSIPNGVTTEDACWERVVAALITLSSDRESTVRSWACFELAQLEADTEVALAALTERWTIRTTTRATRLDEHWRRFESPVRPRPIRSRSCGSSHPRLG
jgi:HEAT repeat protein